MPSVLICVLLVDIDSNLSLITSRYPVIIINRYMVLLLCVLLHIDSKLKKKKLRFSLPPAMC